MHVEHAGRVLPDEPTNRLYEESVGLLAKNVLSITGPSVMVVSHEPKFLNKLCTLILAHKDMAKDIVFMMPVDVPAAELSTGLRRRLTLAVSMLKHANVLLLDEPTIH